METRKVDSQCSLSLSVCPISSQKRDHATPPHRWWNVEGKYIENWMNSFYSINIRCASMNISHRRWFFICLLWSGFRVAAVDVGIVGMVCYDGLMWKGTKAAEIVCSRVAWVRTATRIYTKAQPMSRGCTHCCVWLTHRRCYYHGYELRSKQCENTTARIRAKYNQQRNRVKKNIQIKSSRWAVIL